MLLQPRPAQIQVAVAQPRFLGHRPFVGDRERRRLASFSSRTSDATTSTSPVSSFGFTVSALRRSTVPRTPTTISVRSFLASCDQRVVVADDDLRDAVAIADVEEEDGAHVAHAVDPSEQDGRLADVGGPQRAAGVGSTKVSEWLHCV